MKRHTLSSLISLKGAHPLIGSEHPHSGLREASHHPCIQCPSSCSSALRSALFGLEMSCICRFRGLSKSVTFLIFDINRDFQNIRPMPGTVLGSVETERNPTELLLPLGNCPMWVIPLGPLTVTPVTFRGQKTKFEPVGQTNPKLPCSLRCCPVTGPCFIICLESTVRQTCLWVWWL